MTTATSVNITRASSEWWHRPDDERFLTLEDLQRSVSARKHRSWTTQHKITSLEVIPDSMDESDRGLSLQARDRVSRRDVRLTPSHWSFGQLCSMIGVPASYARRLPAGLACINLQWNLEHHPTSKPDALILGLDDPLELAEGEPGDPVLRAMTGTTYGRIWDSDVVSGIRKATEGQPWKVPSASYASSDPKRATTLYASDRDVFIFLVDESRPIEVNGDTLYRGFYAWNSEVGSAAFGLTTFLYRYVCDNRIIWGATEVEELRIRHTGGAPDRFGREGARFLERYAKESSGALEGQIKGAQEKEIADSEKGVHEWLRKRGFSKSVAEGAVTRAKEDGDNPRNLWSIIQGLTAQARSDAHTDSRVDLERKAGRLMKYA